MTFFEIDESMMVDKVWPNKSVVVSVRGDTADGYIVLVN